MASFSPSPAAAGSAAVDPQRGDGVFVYGLPPPDVLQTPSGADQVSPLAPGSTRLEDVAEGDARALVIAAPPGTLERRYVLALALRALRPHAPLSVLAPKQKGGARLRQELEGFGCEVEELGRRHHRICHTTRPGTVEGLEAALAAGAPRLVPGLGWSQPGVFSWDRPDAGTRLLAAALPALAGRGADLGCGIGGLAQAVLPSAGVTRLALIDLDRRAVDMARRNVEDARAVFHWADARGTLPLEPLDFVVTNPPFHDGGAQDMDLGRAFLRRSHGLLRPGGALWMVANRHLPYEAVLKPLFAEATLRAEDAGFKVYKARR